MTFDLILALVVYAFVTSITPGPNNTMLLASGVNYGFFRTIPHILGVTVGFSAMVLAVGAGLGSLFMAFPILHAALRWIGGAYLLWLAWKIASSGTIDHEASAAKPMTFSQAAAFQWVNPKCWVMATGAITAYLPAHGSIVDLVAMTTVYALVNGPCVASWAGFGMMLRRWLTDPTVTRVFNIAMATLLVFSLQPLVAEGLR